MLLGARPAKHVNSGCMHTGPASRWLSAVALLCNCPITDPYILTPLEHASGVCAPPRQKRKLLFPCVWQDTYTSIFIQPNSKSRQSLVSKRTSAFQRDSQRDESAVCPPADGAAADLRHPGSPGARAGVGLAAVQDRVAQNDLANMPKPHQNASGNYILSLLHVQSVCASW